MGDVALAAPIVRSLANSYPALSISIATRPKFAVFFHGVKNVKVIGVDLDKDYKGFGGIFQLFSDLKKAKPTIVFDLHDHLRTKFLRFFFRCVGIKTLVFEKGRSEKKKAVKPGGKLRKQLTHTVERYQKVFQLAGLNFPIVKAPFVSVDEDSKASLINGLLLKYNLLLVDWSGSFAAHESKMWPIDKYIQIIEKLSTSSPYHFFLSVEVNQKRNTEIFGE